MGECARRETAASMSTQKQYRKRREADDVMFKHHPFVAPAIASLDLYILNKALLASYREMMRNVVAGGTKVRVLWGEGDQTVPYRFVCARRSGTPLVEATPCHVSS